MGKQMNMFDLGFDAPLEGRYPWGAEIEPKKQEISSIYDDHFVVIIKDINGDSMVYETESLPKTKDDMITFKTLAGTNVIYYKDNVISIIMGTNEIKDIEIHS